jgi:tRNA(Ile)-lysidine synthase
MLAAGDRVLVAVSGGPDSMALLQVLSECAPSRGFEIEVAHFNHRLRGVESDRDQALVEERCEKLGVACHVEQAIAVGVVRNLEETARTERYRFLFRKAKQLQCGRIATGHTRDDQAETVLMRLIRGSGVDGLAAIRAVRRDGVIRPLIDCERPQVVAYLRGRGVRYADDCMNRDPRLLRTHVRQEILPAIRSLNPGLGRTLARTADLAAADADFLEGLASAAATERTGVDGTLSLTSLGGLPEGLRGRVVRIWLKQQRGTLRGVGAVHLNALLRLAEGEGESRCLQVPGGGVIVRQYATLQFESEARAESRQFRHALIDGDTFQLAGGWQVSAALSSAPCELALAERSLWRFWADAEILGGGLVLRNAAPGDRIRPLGLRGHRKLQDIFVDRKVPRARRWEHPVLEAGGRVLWVPGLVRSDHAPILPETRRAWRVAIEPSAVAGA